MAPASGEAQFVIKNGSGSRPDVVIRAVLGGTVAELKAVIQRDYPGNPAPSEQTLIYGGKVLKVETVQLSVIIGPDVREPISMHMVVKSPARTTAPPPASSPVQPRRDSSATPPPSRDTHSSPSPQPPAAAAAAAPSGIAPQQSAPQREADNSTSGAAGSGVHAVGSGAYQPHAASAWMQYQNAAATWGAPPWAMPQGMPAASIPGSQPQDAPYMQFNPALAAAYSAAMASLNDTQPSGGGGGGGSGSGGSGGSGSGVSGSAAGPGGGTNAPSTPPPPFPAAADPTAMLLGMQQPMGYPVVALVPVGMMSPFGMMPAFPQMAPLQPPVAPQAPQHQPGRVAAAAAGAPSVFGEAPNHATGAQPGDQQGQQQQQWQQQLWQQQQGQAAAFGAQPFMFGGMQAPGAGAAFPFGPPPQAPPFGGGGFQLPPGFGGPRAPGLGGPGMPLPPGQHPAAEGLRRRRNGGADPFLRRDANGNYVLVDGRGGVNAAPRAPPRPAVRRVQINLNLRVILQVAVLLLLLYQHCPPGRFLLLVVGGALLYLSAFSPLRAWLQRLAGVAPAAPAANPAMNPGQNPVAGGGVGGMNPNAGAGNAAAADGAQPGGGNANGGGGIADGGHIAPAGAGAAPGGPAGAAAGAPPRRGGVLRELQALLVGFFTSLLPGWNMNPEDAAAFAAAQQMAAAEAAREAPGAGPGAGIDADLNG